MPQLTSRVIARACRGESVEALAGAVVADLFVFVDVRDLVIEAGKTLRGEDNDEGSSHCPPRGWR